MRIAHICLSGLYMNGWGYQDNMLAKYHVRDGHEVLVIANEYMYDQEGNYVKIDGKNYCQPTVDENGVRVVRLPVKGNKVLTGPAQRVHYIGLYDTLQEYKPEIIFLHNPQILDVEEIVRYIKSKQNTDGHMDAQTEGSAEVRLYVDSHSDYSNSGRNFLSKHILHGVLWRSKVQKLVPYTRKFYGVLPARVDFLLERYHTPKEKTELLVMGMDDELANAAKAEDSRKELRERHQIEEDDFLILTGGKIDAAKRQTLLLLEAIRRLNHPKIKLLVMGSVAKELQDEFYKGCAHPSITYIGWLDAKDTYPYVEAADLVIFPGRHSVLWEQVAGQGKPMLVKYWEGTTHVDLGGNVGFLKEDSVEEIESWIRRLVNIPLDEQKQDVLAQNQKPHSVEKTELYKHMETVAKLCGAKEFSYQEIARRGIESGEKNRVKEAP